VPSEVAIESEGISNCRRLRAREKERKRGGEEDGRKGKYRRARRLETTELKQKIQEGEEEEEEEI
jgi:hypothetical protein